MNGLTRREALGLMAAGAMVPGGLSVLGCSDNRARRVGNEPIGLGSGLPAPPREFRGAWVATVDNIDWPSKPGLSTWAQRQEIERILDESARLNLNALFIQVRPTADAIYKSKTEPWSAFLTGEQGKGPTPAYDPLAEFIDGAHARGIDVHAWFNP
ncbi:MAG: family 10 glycosylhydrolase, partial [Planctomycetota bacterium]